MKLYEIKKAALAAVDEEYDQNTRTSGDPALDEVVKNAFNTAYIMISSLVDIPEATMSFEFSASPAALPSDFIGLISMRYPAVNVYLTPDIDFKIKNKFIYVTNSYFENKQLSMAYKSTKTLITDDNSTPDILDYHQNILLQYMIYECLMFKKRSQEAKMRLDLFLSMLEPFKPQVAQESAGK